MAGSPAGLQDVGGLAAEARGEELGAASGAAGLRGSRSQLGSGTGRGLRALGRAEKPVLPSRVSDEEEQSASRQAGSGPEQSPAELSMEAWPQRRGTCPCGLQPPPLQQLLRSQRHEPCALLTEAQQGPLSSQRA